MLRNPFHHYHVGQRQNHRGARPVPLAANHYALLGVLIDQVQYPHRTTVRLPDADEVITPYVALAIRPEPQARSIVEPQAAPCFLLLRILQPFATPDAFDSILAHLPACSIEQRGDAPEAIAPILAGQLEDGPGRSIFILTLCRLIALRAAWMIHQLARQPLAHALLLCMSCRTTPSLWA
jgi:hypothetical protein